MEVSFGTNDIDDQVWRAVLFEFWNDDVVSGVTSVYGSVLVPRPFMAEGREEGLAGAKLMRGRK